MYNNCCNGGNNCCEKNRNGQGGCGQVIVGPQGPQGVQGERGEQGERGPRGYQGAQGARGERGLTGLTGPQGTRGFQGEKGEKGDNGISPLVTVSGTETSAPGTKASVVETFSEKNTNLYFTIPRGDKGEKGDKGDKGDKGERGAVGSAASMIPFSISKHGNSFDTNEKGLPRDVLFAGFGGEQSTSMLKEGEWEKGIIYFEQSALFGATFVMVQDSVLQKILVSVAPGYIGAEIDKGMTVKPFVCLAFRRPKQMVFEVQKSTMVFTDPYVGTGTEVSFDEIRNGKLVDINFEVKEDTVVAIVVGIYTEGTSSHGDSSYNFPLMLSGGLYFEPKQTT